MHRSPIIFLFLLLLASFALLAEANWTHAVPSSDPSFPGFIPMLMATIEKSSKKSLISCSLTSKGKCVTQTTVSFGAEFTNSFRSSAFVCRLMPRVGPFSLILIPFPFASPWFLGPSKILSRTSSSCVSGGPRVWICLKSMHRISRPVTIICLFLACMARSASSAEAN